ncbi:MAG: hypothetical protein V1911_00045 [Candidatus Micrarchaeota archaeon]
MKLKIFIAILLIAGAGLCEYTLEDIGCLEIDSGVWECPIMNFAGSAPIKFTDDIGCFSTNENASCTSNCTDIIDVGCFTGFTLQKDVSAQLCYETMNLNDNTSATNCFNYTWYAADNEALLGIVNPLAIDYTNCDKYLVGNESKVFTIECKGFRGREINAYLSPVSNDLESMLIDWDLNQAQGTAGFQFTPEILFYIVLIIAVAGTAYWAVKPGSKGGAKKITYYEPEKKKESASSQKLSSRREQYRARREKK